MPKVGEDFSHRLTSLREQRKLSINGLAKAIGASRVTIWNWETGRSKPNHKKLMALEQLFGISFGDRLMFSEVLAQSPLEAYLIEARQKIADLAEIEPEQVKISIDLNPGQPGEARKRRGQ